MHLPHGGPTVRQLHAIQDRRGERVVEGLQGLQHAVDQAAEDARADLARRFIHRHHAPGMQRCIAVVFARQRLELRMHDQQVAGVAVEFHFPEEREPLPRLEPVRQIPAVEPLRHQLSARRVGEPGLEQAQVLALEAGQLRPLSFHQNRGQFARRKLRDGLHVAAVFVAERGVGQQVFDGEQTLRFQHRGARRADSLHVLE